MRAYFTTTGDQALKILDKGFTNLHMFCGGLIGVWFADCQLGANEGYLDDVTLCLDVPETVFERYEMGPDKFDLGYRRSLIPAADLNEIGKPHVYDHAYAGSSRVELFRAIRGWEATKSPRAQRKARELRDAVEFFDTIGWLSPLKVHEGEGKGGKRE